MPKLHQCRDGRLIIRTSYLEEVHGTRVRQKKQHATLQVSDHAETILSRHRVKHDGDAVPRELYFYLIEHRLIASLDVIMMMYFGEPAGANLNYHLRDQAYPLWRRYAHLYNSDRSPVANFCTAMERMCEQEVTNPQSRNVIRQFIGQLRSGEHES